jgi:hypothetical protein
MAVIATLIGSGSTSQAAIIDSNLESQGFGVKFRVALSVALEWFLLASRGLFVAF